MISMDPSQFYFLILKNTTGRDSLELEVEPGKVEITFNESSVFVVSYHHTVALQILINKFFNVDKDKERYVQRITYL